MTLKNNAWQIILINILLFVVFVLLGGSSNVNLTVSNATPLIPIALLISISIFYSEGIAVFSGFVFGAFIDSYSSLPFGTSSVFLLVAALASSLIIRHLFNNNLRSAIALCLMVSLLYFTLKWLIVYSSSDLESSIGYLVQFGMPSAVYTTVFVIPFYYLQKFIIRKFAR